MSSHAASLLIALCFGGLIAGCNQPRVQELVQPSTVTYLRVEPNSILDKTGETLRYYVDRPDQTGLFPLLIMVDGSGCRGWQAVGLEKWLQPDHTAPRPYVRLFVDKRGVSRDSLGKEGCSDTFLKSFSIDKRVEDHLRVLQHVRAQADWWDGTLLIAGWSDGGDIAAQLTAYYPNVDRAMLGAMGGGTTMSEQFQDKFFCPIDAFETTKARDHCVADLLSEFNAMKDNPTWTKTWSGTDNTHRVWASRLDTRLTHLLKDVTAPILIIHGANDQNNVPVDSAQTLVADLANAGRDNITYWEIPGMKHTPGSLPDDRRVALMTAMRDWLLMGDSVAMP